MSPTKNAELEVSVSNHDKAPKELNPRTAESPSQTITSATAGAAGTAPNSKVSAVVSLLVS